MSILYSITEAENIEAYSASLFILGSGLDDRTLAMTNILKQKNNNISSIVIIQYEPFDESGFRESFPKANINILDAQGDQVEFLSQLKKIKTVFVSEEALIDITSIRIPEMYTLMKYILTENTKIMISAAYSTPVEYEFAGEPFTSYHSYYGDLTAMDLIGYGGLSSDMSHSQLIVFLGFEGVLSNKVNEDVQYNKLILVNNLPSFYEKYKDISIINNYDLLISGQEHLHYVPANNPFETYNFLSEQIEQNETACIAPLSTKPVALGVCLYALTHESVRVVYPMAETYISHNANSVHNTYVYSLSFLTQCSIGTDK